MHLADEPLERLRRGRSEDLDEVAGCHGCAARQQRKAGAHDSDPREQLSEARHLARATQYEGSPAVHLDPVGRRIDEHQAADLLWMRGCERQTHERAERVADQDARCDAPRCGDQPLKVIEDARQRDRRGRWIAPPQSRPIGTRTLS